MRRLPRLALRRGILCPRRAGQARASGSRELHTPSVYRQNGQLPLTTRNATGRMRRLPLTQGKFALVDDCDYEYLSQWKWYFHKRQSWKTGYASRNKITANSRQTIRMHREVAKLHGFLAKRIDHRDRNGLNNQSLNLRPATPGQNRVNSTLQSNNTSGYRGVCWSERHHKWAATIRVNRKDIRLGYCANKRKAARLYNEAAKKHFGEFAYLNPGV